MDAMKKAYQPSSPTSDKTEQPTAGTVAKHTPGPWEAVGELDGLRVENRNSTDPNSCDNVRQVANVKQSDYEIPNYGEAEANARLIAAAPQMLEALMDIMANPELSRNDWDRETMAVLRAATAAISKATLA